MTSDMPQGVVGFLERISGISGVKRVILFGSRGRGDFAPRSDFDLAVDAPSLSDLEWNKVEDMAEDADTLYKIDCVWLQKTPEDLQKNILRDGKVLFQK